jgi:hypothetical protein
MKVGHEGCVVYIIKVNYYMHALLVCHLFSLIVSAKGFKLQPTKMKLTKSLHLARLEKKRYVINKKLFC